jgi:hypothetical protein
MDIDLIIHSKNRYKKFLERVPVSGVVWGLKEADDSFFVCESNEYEDTYVMAFWSERAYAKSCAVEELSHFEPSPIPLDIFMNNFLLGLDEDGLLVGLNWNSKLIGVEVEPAEVYEKLTKKIEQGYHMFPNDVDGQVLKSLKRDGVNFSQPQDVDFHIMCADEESLQATLTVLHQNDFQVEGFYDEEDDDWYCTIQINMLLEYQPIMDRQEMLNELVKPFGAYCEGWGVLVD